MRAVLRIAVCLLLFSSIYPAQNPVPGPSPTPARSDQDLAVKMMPLGVSMLLAAIIETEPPEEVKMSLAVMGDFLPEELAEEDAKMVEIAYANRDDQVRISKETLASLRKKLPDSEKWTVDIGQAWGKTYGMAVVLGLSGFKGDPTPFLDSLRNLGLEVEKNRKSIPPQILPKLEAICAVAPKTKDVSMGAVVGSFFSETLNLIDYLDTLERPVRRRT